MTSGVASFVDCCAWPAERGSREERQISRHIKKVCESTLLVDAATKENAFHLLVKVDEHSTPVAMD